MEMMLCPMTGSVIYLTAERAQDASARQKKKNDVLTIKRKHTKGKGKGKSVSRILKRKASDPCSRASRAKKAKNEQKLMMREVITADVVPLEGAGPVENSDVLAKLSEDGDGDKSDSDSERLACLDEDENSTALVAPGLSLATLQAQNNPEQAAMERKKLILDDVWASFFAILQHIPETGKKKYINECMVEKQMDYSNQIKTYLRLGLDILEKLLEARSVLHHC